jgi:creatinine amidohydrolase
MVAITAPKVHMGTLTAGEARAAYLGNPVILLPMGSHEEQGPHAPMGDYLLAEQVAERIALAATAAGTPTFVAPVLPFGGADYFGAMPGGIALSAATLRGVLGDMLGCLLRHGLTRLVVINGHGGNVPAIYDVTRTLHRERGVVIPSLYLWRIAYALLPGILGAEQAKAVSSHGADPLTSIGLHLFPGMLRPDLVPAPLPQTGEFLGLKMTGWATATFEGAEVGLPVEYDATYPNGVGGGDPRLCSAETGAALVEQLTTLGARFVAHFAARTG